jgi:hypothetical protein
MAAHGAKQPFEYRLRTLTVYQRPNASQARPHFAQTNDAGIRPLESSFNRRRFSHRAKAPKKTKTATSAEAKHFSQAGPESTGSLLL